MQSWIRGQEQWQPSLWMNCFAISLYQNSCIQTRKDNSSPTWLRSVVYWRFTRHAQWPTNPNVSLVEHFNWTLKHVVNHLERPSLWLGATTKEGMHGLQLKYTYMYMYPQVILHTTFCLGMRWGFHLISCMKGESTINSQCRSMQLTYNSIFRMPIRQFVSNCNTPMYIRKSTYYDRKIHEDKIGELVRLHNTEIPPGQSAKLHHPYTGPYKVLSKISDADYRINQGAVWKKACCDSSLWSIEEMSFWHTIHWTTRPTRQSRLRFWTPPTPHHHHELQPWWFYSCTVTLHTNSSTCSI